MVAILVIIVVVVTGALRLLVVCLRGDLVDELERRRWIRRRDEVALDGREQRVEGVRDVGHVVVVELRERVRILLQQVHEGRDAEPDRLALSGRQYVVGERFRGEAGQRIHLVEDRRL